jgi:hypothetical protein
MGEQLLFGSDKLLAIGFIELSPIESAGVDILAILNSLNISLQGFIVSIQCKTLCFRL